MMNTMRGAIYEVLFESNLGASGKGLLSIRGGRLFGFDEGFMYRGYVKAVGGFVEGRVAIDRKDPNAVSIFGAVDRFELVIRGHGKSGTWHYSGHVVGAEQLRVRFVLALLTSMAA
jgi:hypothetical protein